MYKFEVIVYRLPLSTKRNPFREKELGSGLIHGYYHYKYEVCLDDIFNCFGEMFAIFFPSLLTLFLQLHAKRTFAFTKRSSG